MDDGHPAGPQDTQEFLCISLDLSPVDMHEYVETPDGVDRVGCDHGKIAAGPDDEISMRFMREAAAAVGHAGGGNVDAGIFSRSVEQCLRPASTARSYLQNTAVAWDVFLQHAAGQRLFPCPRGIPLLTRGAPIPGFPYGFVEARAVKPRNVTGLSQPIHRGEGPICRHARNIVDEQQGAPCYAVLFDRKPGQSELGYEGDASAILDNVFHRRSAGSIMLRRNELSTRFIPEPVLWSRRSCIGAQEWRSIQISIAVPIDTRMMPVSNPKSSKNRNTFEKRGAVTLAFFMHDMSNRRSISIDRSLEPLSATTTSATMPILANCPAPSRCRYRWSAPR